MKSNVKEDFKARKRFLAAAIVVLMFETSKTLTTEVKEDFLAEEYCSSEMFQPRCLQNEVVLMTSAIYGRMHIGRCITAEEVEALGSRSLGCSTDVLDFFEKKCSGKRECAIRIFDISLETTRPCFPVFLSLYLEASYDCITIADNKSCVVDVSAAPIHIIHSKPCGIKSQPWILEAPVGQKISVSILAMLSANQVAGKSKESCPKYGTILDPAGKKNTTICAIARKRETKIYSSAGNVVSVFLDFSDGEISNHSKHFILKFQAVGCSDIIPPDDAYLKRNDDLIVVGCYTSRKTWHLSCVDGKWVGVVGNCSHGTSMELHDVENEVPKASETSYEQALAIVAIGGFTLAISMSVICFAAVCFKRFQYKKKKKQYYPTLSYQVVTSAGNQSTEQSIRNGMNCGINVSLQEEFRAQQMPTYSVFVGEGDFSGINGLRNTENANLAGRL